MKRQKGITLLDVLLGLGAGGLFATLLFGIYTVVTGTARGEIAYQEGISWLTTMSQIGSMEGHVYTGLTQTTVVERSAIEDAINTYGLAITAAPVGGNWLLTYNFPSQSECTAIMNRLDDHPGVAATPGAACATGVMTITVE